MSYSLSIPPNLWFFKKIYIYIYLNILGNNTILLALQNTFSLIWNHLTANSYALCAKSCLSSWTTMPSIKIVQAKGGLFIILVFEE